jgi:hypothetical protein
MMRGDLVRRMPMSEFVEWWLLEQLEPFGDRRGDLHAGTVAATIANVNRTERSRGYEWRDMIPDWDERLNSKKIEQTPEQQLQVMLTLQAAQNAIVKRS